MMMPWYEWVGLLGVATILLAFFLLQARRLHGNGLSYQALNAAGAIGVMVSLLLGNFNMPAFVLELAWLLVSIYGMLWNRRQRQEKI